MRGDRGRRRGDRSGGRERTEAGIGGMFGRKGADGGREMAVVPKVEFSSYYGRPIVKPAPWEIEVAAYLFLGGLAAGSGLLAAGAQFTGNAELRRACRFAALGAAGLGTGALIRDLGRPKRFLHMLRTVKITSPMSVGSWLLVAFSGAAGLAAAAEMDRILGRYRCGESYLAPHAASPQRRLIRAAEGAAGVVSGVLAPGLAAYTAVLLTNTATPTWAGARRELPFVFAGSASMAAGGLAMIACSHEAADPARRFGLAGVAIELAATEVMRERMDPTEAEPLTTGDAGRKLAVSRALAAVGGAGIVLSGLLRNRRAARVASVVTGGVLLASSALNRWGVFEAGMTSARDPKYTVEPQKRRLEERRAAGKLDDSITTTL